MSTINFDKLDSTINYQKQLDKLIASLNYTPTLFIHSCCGPCSSYCLEYLSKYFDITVFYFNPNIYPPNEYDDRISEQKKIINYINIKNDKNIKLIEGDYNTNMFYKVIEGLHDEKEGGLRCIECYKLRLEEAAKLAKEFNFEYFATTLTISPHKNEHILNAIGRYYADKYNIKYLNTSFKKKNGFKRSVELTTELGIYRQDYCGCYFSKKERELNDK